MAKYLSKSGIHKRLRELGCRTRTSFYPALQNHIEQTLRKAVARARANGRLSVDERDL